MSKRALIVFSIAILFVAIFISAVENETYAQPNCSWLDKDKARCSLSGGVSRDVKMDYGSYGGNTCPWIVCDYSKPSAFSTRESCEASNNFCSYKECTHVPYGKTYEETCGKNFVKGWYYDAPKSTEGMSCQYGGDCSSSLTCQSNKCVKYQYNYSCYDWSEEQVIRERSRCEKNGGQLIKSDNYMGGCSSYRCFSSEKCGSSSDGYLECNEGYYCEQPNYNNQNYYEGSSNFGKCVKIPSLNEKPTPSSTPKVTSTNTPTQTPSPSPSPSPTQTPTPNPLPTQSPTPNLTPVPTQTPKTEELNQVEDVNKILEVALKLEEVKMQFDDLSKRLLSLEKYYQNKKNNEYSKKFRKASDLLGNSVKKIDEVKTVLRNSVENNEVNNKTFDVVKNSIKSIKDNIKEVTKELLND